MPREFPTIATSTRRAPKVPSIILDKPQVYDRRLINIFLGGPRNESVSRLTDQKDSAEARSMPIPYWALPIRLSFLPRWPKKVPLPFLSTPIHSKDDVLGSARS